jgi:hypothetical protein
MSIKPRKISYTAAIVINITGAELIMTALIMLLRLFNAKHIKI